MRKFSIMACLLGMLLLPMRAQGIIVIGAGATGPVVIAYDSFTRADAASLGSTEATGPASESLTQWSWTDGLGSYEIFSNRAEADDISGFAAATINVLQAAGKVSVNVSWDETPVGVAGICIAYVDYNNFIRAYHNGTEARLIKKVGGADTTLINIVTTYVANAAVRIDISGTSYSLYYNGSQVGTTQTISDSVFSGVYVYGLYTNNAATNLDNFTVWSQ